MVRGNRKRESFLLLALLVAFSLWCSSTPVLCSEKGVKYFWHNEVTGESTWTYPNWKHWSSEHSRSYYIDPETKETTWDLPDKYAWEELNDLESGNTYYHNKNTKETTWTTPEMFAWKRVAQKEEL